MTPKLCLSCIITMMFQTVCCQAQDNDREYWIDRYLSVSYPLEQIHVTSPYGKRKDPFTGKASHHCPQTWQLSDKLLSSVTGLSQSG